MITDYYSVHRQEANDNSQVLTPVWEDGKRLPTWKPEKWLPKSFYIGG